MRRSRFVLALSGLSTLMAAVGIGLAHSAEMPSPQPSAESNERQADGRSPRSKVMKKITIRGVCRDERGTPVTDARVRVFRYPSRLEAPLLVADLRADEGGKFVAEEIATAIDDADFGQTGDVCVAATAERHVSNIRWINQQTLLEAVPAIDPFEPRASNRRNTDVIDLLLELRGSPGTISGTVTDESGRAISAVRVFLPSVFQQPLPDIRSAVTDEAGRYSIADLNPWPTGEDISSEEKTVVTSIVFLLEWADWWQKNWAKQVHDAAYARVNLPPLVAAEANAPPPPGMHFKVDSGGSGWVLESVLNPKSKTVFYDFDTGRVSDLPEKWRGAKNIEPLLDEIINWARQEGFDLMGTEFVSPKGGPSVFALRSIGLHAWELGDHRWKMQSGDITLEDLQAEGTPAGDLLLHRDKESKAIDPQAIASFLYITREGTPGLLFVGIEVQDDSLQPGGRMQGDVELQPIAFRKGRRFGFKNFTEHK